MAKFRLHLSKTWTWILGCLAVLIILVSALSYLVHSDYLRRNAERQMNRHLKGYTVRIGRAYFHPITKFRSISNPPGSSEKRTDGNATKRAFSRPKIRPENHH